ncbi:peptidase m48 family [Pyrrhoderma noxium]|uniref:Peptidase m48 family n=1 Tax=Pyrrhoderma noxium TaxID=2282107 RepID=A0A286U615_9AGAM|nr:peptidase m48 family [Pyrrhoderma noxium]
MKREIVQGHVPTRSGPRRSKRIAAREEHQLVVPRPYIGSNQKALDSKGPRPPISKRAKPTSRKKPPSSKRPKPPNSVGELTKACIRLNIKPESSPAKVKTEKVYLDFNVNYFGDNYNLKDQGSFTRETTEEVVELHPPQMDIPAREFGAMLDEYHLKWQKISAIKIGDTDTDTIRFIDIPWPNERVLNSNQYLQKEAVAKFFLTKDWPEVKKRSQQDILKEEKRRWMEHAEKLEKWVRNGVGLLLFYYVYSHYEKVPASERMRFVFTKPSIYWENGFSKKMYWDLLEMYEQLEEEVVSLTDPTFRRVENVLSDILDANDLGILMDSSKKPRKTASKNSKGEEGLREWRLIIIKDDNIKNAMAARGLIIVFTGVLNILPKDDNNNALAALLGHEVAHVVLSHASERLNSAIAFGIVSLVIMGYIDISTISQLISYVFGSHYTYKNLYEELYTLPNKRSAEHEADILGMKLAAQACYDPKGAVTLQKRLDEYEKEVIQKIGNKNKNPDPEYRRTHPKGEHRIDQLNANLPEAISLRAASDYCSNGFIQSLKFWRS